MTLFFRDYEVLDAVTQLHFESLDPGPGQPNDYFITLTDAELAATTNQTQLRNLVQTKLDRKLRALGGISTKLDPFIGQSLTVV